MPYITNDRKIDLDSGDIHPSTPGELNYLITKLCINYLNIQGTSYSSINDIVGVLECAKQEFYTRIARPYEDQKIHQNGDVY